MRREARIAAEGLAALAEPAEESEYAREAEHDADHEVDQAFAAAIRQATLRRPTLTGEAIELPACRGGGVRISSEVHVR